MRLRNVAFITAVSMGAKVRRPQELWSVFLDGTIVPDKILPLTEEEYAAIKKRHGVN